MPIVPGTEPIQQPQQVPYQRLPLEPILRSAENTQKRLNVAQDRLGQLQMDMAEADILPIHQEQFMAATEGIRERIGAVAEADQLWNKLPAIRREARKAAEMIGQFKGQKEQVQKTLQSIEESNRSEAQKQVLRNRVIQQARNLSLDDEGRIDPSTMYQGREVGDVKDIGSYLRDELDLKSQTREQITREDGVITKKTFRGVSPQRAMREAYRLMGFAQDEEGNLRQVSMPSDPQVQEWLQNERAVIESRFRNRNRNAPEESRLSEEELQKKVDQRMNAVIQNEVRSAAESETSGGLTTTFQRDPAYIGRGGDGESDSDSDDVGRATWGVGRAIASEQTKKLADEMADAAIDTALDKFGMSRGQYEQIRKDLRQSSAGNVGVYGQPLGAEAIQSKKEIFKNKYGHLGEDAWEAYKAVRDAETDARKGAMERRTIQFNTDATEYNKAKRDFIQVDPNHLESPDGYQTEQIKKLTANEKNFELVDMADDKSWLRVRSNVDAEADQWFGLWGVDDIGVGDIITLTPKNVGAFSGQNEYTQGPFDELIESLPAPVRQQMNLQEEVGGASISSEWTQIPSNPDVEIKIDTFDGKGVINGQGALRPNYVAKQGGEEITVGRIGKAIVQGRVNEDQVGSLLTNISKALANKGIGIPPDQVGAAIRRVYSGDTEGMDPEIVQRMEDLMDETLYATTAGEALGWAKSIRQAESQ